MSAPNGPSISNPLSAYVPGTKAWFPDKDQGWISATLIKPASPSSSDDVVLEFTLDETGQPRTVKTTRQKIDAFNNNAAAAAAGGLAETTTGGSALPDGQLPPLRNPPMLEATDDLTNLSYLNEPAVLHTILNRYSQRNIYTYSGIVLIAVNPFYALNLYSPEVIQAYSGKRRGELEPHLFAIAEDAYRCMIRDEKDQTIVVSGESGAGKTVSAKYIMRYFATVEDPDRPTGVSARKALPGNAAAAAAAAANSAATANGGMSETEQQILATNPIMEAFGNAKTTRNDNSSRFGKYIEILFDKKHVIVGAKMRTYLLERSRLVYQPETERNYHIFYQLCAGAPSSERKDLGLEDAKAFHYLNQGGDTVIAGVNDAEEFRATQKALSTVGLTIEKQWQIFRLLAALLHLGNVQITATRNDSMIAEDEQSLFIASRMIGIDTYEFKKWIVKKQLTTRGEKIVSNLNLQQAIGVRDSVAKYIYSSLFDWLVVQMNHSLALGSGSTRDRMIGVLDIYGFERFKVNSYEQFCINYANERLQHEFNEHVFRLEQEEYMNEKIQWTFINFSDNQPTIDMIESKLGILSLLDEESRLPSGSDGSFLTKLFTQLDRRPEFKNSFKHPRFGNSSFTVCHYALDVNYAIEGFLEKNRDTVPDEQLALLQSTTNPFLKEVFDAAFAASQAAKEAQQQAAEGAAAATSGDKGAAAAPAPAPGLRKVGGIVKKPTLGSQFKASLVSLMDTIDNTNVHYIRCIKPNEQKKAWAVEPQSVLGQLRACGVLETIRISCAGYPSRWTFSEFAARYYMLVPSQQWDMSSEEAARQLSSVILKSVVSEDDKYQIGLTKLFFRAGMLAHFEQRRTDRLNHLTTLIQKNLRRHVYQKRYQTMRTNSVKIQSWWRMKLAQSYVAELRLQTTATRLQTAIRAHLARQHFSQVRTAMVRLQALIRGRQVRARFAQTRTHFAATRLQSLFRGVLARRQLRRNRQGIILIQSMHRRRLAKRELIALRNEAKSVKHFKEVSGKLENKVVELTQNLQKRTRENKELVAKIRALEAQVAQWQGKHDELDAKARVLQTELDKPSVPHAEWHELLIAKKEVDAKHEASLRRINEHEKLIAQLREEAANHAQELEARENAIATSAKTSEEDIALMNSLRAEIGALKEQLNRANALNTLQKNSQRIENAAPPVFNMATGRENGYVNAPKRRARRHSEAEALEQPMSMGDDEDVMAAAKRSAAIANRHVSVAFGTDGQIPGFGQRGVYDEDYDDDPSEEIIKILENEEQLDEDVLNGLIRYLKIPAPSLQNPPSPKEVLFPAHLISLVTNEMWKYGMVRESERFLANVMQTIQQHVMSFQGDDAIVPGIFWLSNVHEILSFVCIAESDMLQGIGPGADGAARSFEWGDYERLVTIVKHDLDSLEYNIYHTWMQEAKKKLHKMVIPALVESQSLPGFVTSDGGGGRLFRGLLSGATTPPYAMDDILAVLNKVWKSLKSYYVEPSVTQQVVTELLKLIGVTSFNDLLMRRNFCSWKRAMQIQYNITRIEEWCKSHDMPEGTLQLEHLMQATKLLQLKKATLGDIDIIYDVCWMLTPTQIQKLISHYYVADYENPISPEILKAVAARVVPNDRNDHLLLPPEVDEAGPYELPIPREVTGIETYCPAYISVPSIRRLASKVA
ncbi:myosin V [Tilletiaria anomala UBC 951]|uniref:Myosin V n=1 Tax=Tilletiaria anomala (strain ATCC 24038 / CBS 436.72 / UBC 951) TaxID=1037660 RepID=A0A066VTF0_TILAU|nr:myosin V [Tilletiaria anomala UBC 951]KDN44751.1 myosin V [Tilletiaria anomala UBC 951]